MEQSAEIYTGAGRTYNLQTRSPWQEIMTQWGTSEVMTAPAGPMHPADNPTFKQDSTTLPATSASLIITLNLLLFPCCRRWDVACHSLAADIHTLQQSIPLFPPDKFMTVAQKCKCAGLFPLYIFRISTLSFVLAPKCLEIHSQWCCDRLFQIACNWAEGNVWGSVKGWLLII